MYDHIESFDKVLRDNSPEETDCALIRARNSFMRYYGHYNVAPEIALAIATPEELLRLRNAGAKCQRIYANARDELRKEYAESIKDILELKQAFYEETDKTSYWIGGVDRMILQCVERGMRSKRRFELTVAMTLAYPGTYVWDGDIKLVGKVFCKLTKKFHPEIENPQTYIVRYPDENKEICYLGVSPIEGKDQLLEKLNAEGYKANMSGRINGYPIRFINCEKIQEVKN